MQHPQRPPLSLSNGRSRPTAAPLLPPRERQREFPARKPGGQGRGGCGRSGRCRSAALAAGARGKSGEAAAKERGEAPWRGAEGPFSLRRRPGAKGEGGGRRHLPLPAAEFLPWAPALAVPEPDREGGSSVRGWCEAGGGSEELWPPQEGWGGRVAPSPKPARRSGRCWLSAGLASPEAKFYTPGDGLFVAWPLSEALLGS